MGLPGAAGPQRALPDLNLRGGGRGRGAAGCGVGTPEDARRSYSERKAVNTVIQARPLRSRRVFV